MFPIIQQFCQFTFINHLFFSGHGQALGIRTLFGGNMQYRNNELKKKNTGSKTGLKNV